MLTRLLPSLQKIWDKNEVPRGAYMIDLATSGWSQLTYHYSVIVAALVFLELFPRTEAGRADIHTVSRFAHRIRTFDADGVREITHA
jgi:hypothetical protein